MAILGISNSENPLLHLCARSRAPNFSLPGCRDSCFPFPRFPHQLLLPAVWWLPQEMSALSWVTASGTKIIQSLGMKFRVKMHYPVAWSSAWQRDGTPKAAGCQRSFGKAWKSPASLGLVSREPQLVSQAHVSELSNSASELSYCAKNKGDSQAFHLTK